MITLQAKARDYASSSGCGRTLDIVSPADRSIGKRGVRGGLGSASSFFSRAHHSKVLTEHSMVTVFVPKPAPHNGRRTKMHYIFRGIVGICTLMQFSVAAAGPNWHVIHEAEAHHAHHAKEHVVPLDHGPRAITTPWLSKVESEQCAEHRQRKEQHGH